MNRFVHLPTGPRPGWELDDPRHEQSELKSVPESLVVLQSLRQSRTQWLSTTFPKFSVKTRGGKPAEVIPPPHTIKAHGKYDLYIGPHHFSYTAIYEVHYLPEAEPQPPEARQAMLQVTIPAAQSSGSGAVQASLSSIEFPSGTYVTPALSSKVTVAAQSNPVLANLLSAVINRTATDDQVKTLGLLIQSLEGVQPLTPPEPPPVQPANQLPARQSSPKPFDIILEFHERPSDRFILPRGNVVCELVAPLTGYRAPDLIITCCLPFPGTASYASTEQTGAPALEVVSFRLLRASQSLWELFSSWAGGPQRIEESRAQLAAIVQQARPQTFLQHRLPEGELATEIRNAVAPPYTLKPIKPAGADSTRAKRKSVSRRSTTVLPGPAPPPNAAPVKRHSLLKSKIPPPLSLIACQSCHQTDVPLMMGGREHSESFVDR
ncbi:hypothetical protein BD413DRAFT_465460 [Trametes elegans]|nr:hypothetical protein BD413DRAFT_465460 [Trametes elegans]